MENELKEYLDKLNLFVPIVNRVHGKEHPEFNRVQSLYNDLVKKLDAGEKLEEIFAKLREVTNNYEVPSDTCESYEAVYHMLAKLDQHFTK